VRAKVSHLGVNQLTGRLRHQDLSAVPGGCDASRAVNIEADVALVDELRLACVQAHAHRNRARV
jgi:hypothetical protein